MTWWRGDSQKAGQHVGQDAALEEKQGGTLWRSGVGAMRKAVQPFCLLAQFSPIGMKIP